MRDATGPRDATLRRDAALSRDAAPRRDSGGRRDSALPLLRPDLLVASFTAQAAANGSVTYTIVTCNRGAASSAASQLGLYLDLPSAPTLATPPSRLVDVVALGVGQCQLARLTLTLQSGNYRSWTRADVRAVIAESNEGNNLAGPVVLAIVPGRPDLVISALSVAAGTTQRATVYQTTVCNRGVVASPATRLGIFFDRLQAPSVNSAADREVAVPALQPQQCSSQTASVALASGAYFSWALVDPRAAVVESNEANNVWGPQVFLVLNTATIPPACVSACSALVTPCGLLARNQQQNCALLCATRTAARIACAGAAAASGRCFSIVGCLLLP
ncbi:MAG: hypothetical protein IPL40_05235 [Proteobacteria bacterium]|nr:hypothetical protein [Pseudomonadota bacterium]